MRTRSKSVALLTVGLILATAGVLWQTGLGRPSTLERKPLFYQDSMHAWVKSDKPAKCTVCSMDLTPIYEGQQGFGLSDDIVMLSTNSITVLNVQREEVKRRTLARALRVAGTLEAKETHKAIVASPAPARVVSVAVENPGVEIEEGQTMLTLYSPELVVKRQYASRATNSMASTLIRSGQQSEVYNSDIGAPISGTVVERNVYKGQYVAEGEKLLTIVDTSVLVFRFDAYERQLPWLEPGQLITVSIPALPGKTFRGQISLIEPVLNDATRTLKVRAEIQNPMVDLHGHKQRLLRVGMYADGRVRTELPNVLAAPRSAILFPGGKAYAYVEKGDGAYQRRTVKLGRQGDTFWEVLGGLEESERVVTSGNVLIDAQAQFNQQAKPDREDEENEESVEMADADEGCGIMAERAGMKPMGAPALAVGERSVPPPMQFEPGAQRPGQLKLAAAALSNAVSPEATDGSRRAIANPRAFRSMTAMANRDRGRDVRRATILETLAKENSTNPAEPANETSKTLGPFLAAAGAISQSLAEDNLEHFNQRAALLPSFLSPLEKTFAAPHRWSQLIQKVAAASQLKPAKDLADARAQFLPFSTALVNLVKQVRKEDKTVAGLKIYHCPMAPKPGLWMQSKGPLRNPFYGAKMLECGEEVTQ